MQRKWFFSKARVRPKYFVMFEHFVNCQQQMVSLNALLQLHTQILIMNLNLDDKM